jgi:MFS family permease
MYSRFFSCALGRLRPAVGLPATTYLLSLAQAVNLTCAVIAVTVAAVVGAQLAATPALGTVPYGAQFASVMLCTYPASMLMRRWGRRRVFSGAALVLVAAGAIGFLAIEQASFTGLVITHVLLGVYIACANFYRFAAVDPLPAPLKARAMSLVVAGGVLAALLGPFIASALRSVSGFALFAWCYGVFMVLGLATLAIMACWRPPVVAAESASVPAAMAHEGRERTPARLVRLAIFCAAGAYFVMNLLMVQASLVLKDICSFAQASQAIQVHVLAMFAPSFFTGSLIARWGLQRVLVLGCALLCVALGCGLVPLRYESAWAALFFLGLGWNLAYVGGGTLLAQSVSEGSRHRWQGINDTVIAASATLGAFLPAPMLAVLGWRATHLMVLPLCAGGMFLCWRLLAAPQRTQVRPA